MKTYRYQKQKAPLGMFLMALIILCILGYFLSGLYILEGAGPETLEDSIAYIFTHPLYGWANEKTPACIGAAVIAWFAFISYYMSYYRNFHFAAEHGSADWGNAMAVTKELEDAEAKYNRILAKNLKVSLRSGLSNNNMLVIGSSGSFKTTSLMHQNILQMGATYVILDVKGDTQRKLGKKFIKAGYALKSLNLKEPSKSDRWNPFVYIEREDDLIRLIKTLQDSVRPPKNMSAADPFWDDGVRLFLQALFYTEWLEAKEEKRAGSMNRIMKLVNLESQRVSDKVTRLQRLMDQKAAAYGEDYPPVRYYRKLKEGAPDTVRSIVIMVNAMLSLCETAEIERIFSGNDINIRELGTGVDGNPDKKTVLFLVLPDNNQAYNFLIAMFYTQMFDILIRLSDEELKKPLPCHVEVWMDEFYAGAKPADPDVLLGVVRSRNITMIPILQSISQIKSLYRDDKWETIMDNTATVVYLGSGPLAESTHKYISEALGKATIDTRGDSQQRGKNGSAGLNFNRSGRELMTPEEVKRIPRTECIVFLESRPPVYDTKAIPFDLPKEGFAAPKELKKRYQDALSLGGYEHPVEVYYDEKRLKYYTLEPSRKLTFPDAEEAEKLKKAAKYDEHIQYYEIDEKDLLYFSFETSRKTQEEMEQFLKESIAEEEAEKEYQKANLLVLNGLHPKTKEKPDKAGWDREGNLAVCLGKYFSRLSPAEQEMISLALEQSMPEEDVKSMIFMPPEKMQRILEVWEM